MWYCQQSSSGPAVTFQPASSPISRTTQSAGSSPSSSFPPGSSHSARSFSSSSTFPAWTVTPLTDTGNVRPASPRTGSLALTCLLNSSRPPYLTRPYTAAPPRTPARRDRLSLAIAPSEPHPGGNSSLKPAGEAMDTFRAHHADILDPAQQPRVIALLREHGLVTFTGITSRTELASVARRLMSIRPHRDAGPDGVTVITDTGTAEPGYAAMRPDAHQ